MAPLPPIADIWQVTTFGVLGGMPCDHVINYNFPLGAQDVLQVSKDFADADALAMTNHIIPLLQPAYQHLSSRCIYLGSATAPEGLTLSGAVGTSTYVFGSHANCWTVRHTAGVRGKGKDGRTNFPGPATNFLDQGTGELSQAGLIAYQASWDAYQSEIQATMITDLGTAPTLVILNKGHTGYRFPIGSDVDAMPNTHRRWQKRLARHRRHA